MNTTKHEEVIFKCILLRIFFFYVTVLGFEPGPLDHDAGSLLTELQSTTVPATGSNGSVRYLNSHKKIAMIRTSVPIILFIHLENVTKELSITAKKIFFFRYYLSSAGCLYVSIYVSM